MKRKEHFIGRIVKTVAFMGLAAALAGVWHNAAGIQAAGKTYPVVVPVATSPGNISDPNATAAPTSAPSYGPSEQYKLLNIKTSGNFDYVVVDETNRYASIVKIRNYGEDVVIPETVDGYKVVFIGIPYDSEYDNEDLTDEAVLELYPELYTKNNLPNRVRGVDYIRRCVVDYNDYTIKSLRIPEGVSVITAGAFGNMYSLTNVEFPSSLHKIDRNNFGKCISLKNLTFKGDIKIESSFYGVNLDRITAYGSFSCGDEEYSTGICGSVKQFVFDKKAFNNCRSEKMAIAMYALGIKELVIPKDTGDVNILDIYEADIDKIILGNPNLTIKGEGLKNAFNKLESTTKKVKLKINRKTHKYTYSWNKINCKIKGKKDSGSIREVSTKYVLYRKNSKGKYVKFKTTNAEKYVSKKKLKLKIKREITVKRYVSSNSKWFDM